MQQTAEVINFERPIVKADVSEGFDRLAGKLTDTLMDSSYKLSGHEFRIILAIISKTYRYHKKTDWMANSQLSELTGIAPNHIGTIKKGLIERKILIKNGNHIGVNPVVSEWGSPENRTKQKSTISESKVRNSGADSPEERSNQSEIPDTHKKTIKQKTTNTKDYCAKRATQLPDDFQVTDEMISWARKNGITANIDFETDQFKDHHQARGNTMKDWGKAWQTWMRNTLKFSGGGRARKPNSKARPENFAERDYGETQVGFEL